jgi:hypothetical protein
MKPKIDSNAEKTSDHAPVWIELKGVRAKK